MSTATGVEVLAGMPIGDLLALYEAVAFELERAHEKGAANAAP